LRFDACKKPLSLAVFFIGSWGLPSPFLPHGLSFERFIIVVLQTFGVAAVRIFKYFERCSKYIYIFAV